MDIGSQVTVDYRLKRGNYVVESDNNNRAGSGVHHTSEGIRTYTYNRVLITITHRGKCRGECGLGYQHGNEGQEGSSVREEDRVQGEPLQRGCTKQILRRSRSLAVDVGKAGLVSIETNSRSTQVCDPQIRDVVQSAASPSRKELVLSNESV
jgi:hypothetical protein